VSITTTRRSRTPARRPPTAVCVTPGSRWPQLFGPFGEELRTERDALIHTLAAAAGLDGRTRRLGDQSERARWTVSARVRDALGKIDQAHPPLAAHLRAALRMGTACSYVPDEPTTWKRR
jgi:hypothetical protein